MANFDWNAFAGTMVDAGKDIYGTWTQYDLQRRHSNNLVNNPFASSGIGSGGGSGYLNIGSGGVSSAFSGGGSVALLLLALLLFKR